MPLDDQTVKRAKQQAYRLLSYRSRTAGELRDRLRQKGFGLTLIDEVLHQLEGEGYVNDRKFAGDWARYRLQAKPIGRRRLALELQRRGLDRALIEEVLREVYSEFDEVTLARQVAQKRLRVAGSLQTQNERQRIVRYLAGQGFDSHVIRSALGLDSPPEEWPDLLPDDASC
jgi:regulatory protein